MQRGFEISNTNNMIMNLLCTRLLGLLRRERSFRLMKTIGLGTAYKYKIDFEHFLNYIKICDQEGLLDLGKEAIQEVVIKYVKYLRDDPKKHSRSTINCRISAILYFLDNDIELNKRKIKRYFSRSTAIHGRIVASG